MVLLPLSLCVQTHTWILPRVTAPRRLSGTKFEYAAAMEDLQMPTFSLA